VTEATELATLLRPARSVQCCLACASFRLKTSMPFARTLVPHAQASRPNWVATGFEAELDVVVASSACALGRYDMEPVAPTAQTAAVATARLSCFFTLPTFVSSGSLSQEEEMGCLPSPIVRWDRCGSYVPRER